MKILVINSGSSSLKYQFFDMESEKVIVKGNCERISQVDSKIVYSIDGQEEIETEVKINNHHEAFENIIRILTDDNDGVISDMSEIDAIGHRIVHGGEKLVRPEILTEKVEEEIEETVPLAPLHNAAALEVLRACKKILSNIPQVTVFDTAFHSTIPKYAQMYAIPYKFYEDDGIKKYGFHGISHEYVSNRAAEMLKKNIKSLNIITFHLGNGSSCTAIKRGTSFETSMGFTPIDGLVMGTRCGSIDVAIIKYLSKEKGMSIEKIDNILNKESGVLGISGISSDFRDLATHANNGNERARLALDMFCYSAKKYIGSFLCIMGGLDVIVFTGGIGENAPFIRSEIVRNLEFLGIELDEENNKKAIGEEMFVSTIGSKICVVVIPTNEELLIARETKKALKKEE
ncbi:MAG: acetate kinase [Clostridiales bacterium]|jgi:acetate kinase|nr:acetate kinase [Clostridiales bacterium]